MAKIDVSDQKALKAAVEGYLSDFPGDMTCALQLWYEGLGGQGVPDAAEMAAIQDTISSISDWNEVGGMRYEKYGVQRSYKFTGGRPAGVTNAMVQHIFKRDGLYKEPDGTVLKIIVSEVWNLRCFEIKDGRPTGAMIKIHPESDRAKALVEVV